MGRLPSLASEGSTGPRADEDSLEVVAAGLSSFAEKCAARLAGLSIADVVLGLRALKARRAREQAAGRTRAGAGAQAADLRGCDAPMLARIRRHAIFASAAYQPSQDTAAEFIRAGVVAQGEVRIERWSGGSAAGHPAYFIAVDEVARAVMLCIRGTASLSDAMTDLMCDAAPATPRRGGATHLGMGRAATWVDADAWEQYSALLQRHAGYDAVLCGHSLGAGTAAVLALQWRRRVPALTATCFATPACVDDRLAAEAAAFVTSVVLRDDIVPRWAAHQLAALIDELRATDWWEDMLAEDDEEGGGVGVVAGAGRSAAAAIGAARKSIGEARRSVAAAGEAAAGLLGLTPPPTPPPEQAAPAPADELLDLDLGTRLVPAGRVLHLRRRPGDAEAAPPADTDAWYAPVADVARIELTSTAVEDHLMTNYIAAIDAQEPATPAIPPVPPAGQAAGAKANPRTARVLHDLLCTQGRAGAPVAERMHAAFTALDADGSGALDRREFAVAYLALDNFGSPADAVFERSDVNKDGVLQYDEFAALMARRLAL